MDKKKSTNKIKEGRRYHRHHLNVENTERHKKRMTSKNEPDVENSGFDVEGKEKRKTAKK